MSDDTAGLEEFSKYFEGSGETRTVSVKQQQAKRFMVMKLTNDVIFVLEVQRTDFSFFLKLPFKSCFMIFNFLFDIVSDITNSKLTKDNLLSTIYMTKFHYLRYSFDTLKAVLSQLIAHHLHTKWYLNCEEYSQSVVDRCVAPSEIVSSNGTVGSNSKSDEDVSLNEWDIVTDGEGIRIPIGDSKKV